MIAQDLMSGIVWTCRPSDTLERAARLLWDADVGALPVVDERLRPIAMITDVGDVECLMQTAPVRRVPVVRPTGELIGIITLLDLAHAACPAGVSKTVCAIAERRASVTTAEAAE